MLWAEHTKPSFLQKSHFPDLDIYHMFRIIIDVGDQCQFYVKYLHDGHH